MMNDEMKLANMLEEMGLRVDQVRVVYEGEILTELDLCNQNLKTLSPLIGQLSGLRYLDLSNNQLEVLPPGIGRLRKLIYLVLNENPQLSMLPIEITKLHQRLRNVYLFGTLMRPPLPSEIEKELHRTVFHFETFTSSELAVLKEVE